MFPNTLPSEASPYTGSWIGSDPIKLVLKPPMSRRRVLRVMVLGFGLAVLLVMGAAFIGYQGSQSIQLNAQVLVREHLVNSPRGAELEAQIEAQSKALLSELFWVLGACFVLALSGSALTIWTTDKAFRRLEWQSAELNRVSWHLVDSHETIARRFSHEMHDELGQALAGLRGIVMHMSPEELVQRRGELLEHLDEILTGVRELSQLLRPVILDDFGLDAGLRWLSERFSQRTQIQVDYRSTFDGRIADPLETHFFRIAQEALTNIARHSGATNAWMRLQMVDGRVRLEIEDNGHGIDQEQYATRPSLGMVGMRARARQVHGDLKLENGERGGLHISVDAPFQGRVSDAE